MPLSPDQLRDAMFKLAQRSCLITVLDLAETLNQPVESCVVWLEEYVASGMLCKRPAKYKGPPFYWIKDDLLGLRQHEAGSSG